MSTVPIVSPGIYDFLEDFQSPVVEHGIYSNTCRRCGATINGHKYRRTCRQCVELFHRQAEEERFAPPEPVGVVTRADIPLENIKPVMEDGDLIVTDLVPYRTSLVAVAAFGAVPPASSRKRLNWYADLRAGDTEYRVVETFPKR